MPDQQGGDSGPAFPYIRRKPATGTAGRHAMQPIAIRLYGDRVMVGIVLVSHSQTLAQGAAELATQIAGGVVPVIPAGGTADGRLGTSAELIAAAIASADKGDGVVLIPDLGSAVLSARALLADLDVTASGSSLVLVDAPFVEGAVAAAAAASGGLDLAAVAAAAEEARDARKL